MHHNDDHHNDIINDHHTDVIDMLLTFRRPHLDASAITITVLCFHQIVDNRDDDHHNDTINASMVCCLPSTDPN